jgi:hypothetical protein
MLLRLADEGARVVLVLLALEQGEGAAVGGLLVAALLVPHVLAAPALGLAVDGSARPTALLAVTAGVFATGLAVPAFALGRAPALVSVLALLAAGCCGPALTGGLSSRLPALVPPPRLARAFGVDALTYDVAGIAGPAAGTAVAGWVGAVAGVGVLVAAGLVGAVLTATVHPAPDAARAEPAQSEEGGSGSLLTGIRAVARDRTLGVVTGATMVAQLGFGALPVVVAVAAQRRGSASSAGLLLVAMTVGGLAGSLLWTWRPVAPRLAARVVVLGLLVSGLPLALAGFTASIGVQMALFALSGLADGPVLGALLVVRDRRAPPSARSQVFTLGAGAKITAAAAGAAGIGVVAGAATPVLLVVAGAAPVLAGAAGLIALPRGRRNADAEGVSTTDGTTGVSATEVTTPGTTVGTTAGTTQEGPAVSGTRGP